MFPLEEILTQAKKCTGCGFCLEACPIYDVLGVETLASRGRVYTIQGVLSGNLKPASRMNAILSTCLLCMACQFACPSGVAVHELILKGRHWAIEEKGLPLVKRLAFRRLLKDRRSLGRALGLAKALLQAGPESDGRPLRHLPTLFSGITGARALPTLADYPLLHRVPERTEPWPGVEPRGRVAFFSGCYLEFVDTPIGEAGLRILASQGYEVLYPKGQVCCGAPVLYSGDLEDALEIAKINAEAFSDLGVQAVIALCATCGSALREGYQILAKHLRGGAREKVLRLSRKVVDISQFLNRNLPLRGLTREAPLNLTYHDPCHHIRALGIQSEPRELLDQVRGVRLVEMATPDHCCGGGGSFSLTHPEISLEIGRSKVRDIASTGVQALVTSCPGCILQIQDVAAREKARFEVLHLVEVLDRALPPTPSSWTRQPIR